MLGDRAAPRSRVPFLRNKQFAGEKCTNKRENGEN